MYLAALNTTKYFIDTRLLVNDDDRYVFFCRFWARIFID